MLKSAKDVLINWADNARAPPRFQTCEQVADNILNWLHDNGYVVIPISEVGQLNGYIQQRARAGLRPNVAKEPMLQMYHDAGLKKPVRRFADTFSATTLLKQMFRLSK